MTSLEEYKKALANRGKIQKKLHDMQDGLQRQHQLLTAQNEEIGRIGNRLKLELAAGAYKLSRGVVLIVDSNGIRVTDLKKLNDASADDSIAESA